MDDKPLLIDEADEPEEDSDHTDTEFEFLESPRISDTKRRIFNTVQKTNLARWGKKNDKVLWNVLKELEAESKETCEMIISTDSVGLRQHHKLIRSLCSKSKWRGSAKKFLRRIKKLTLKNSFSFRETKRLKYLLREGISSRNIDIAEISKEFPGKEKSIVLEEIKNIKSQYKIMKNIQIIDSGNNLSLIIN